ARVGGEQGAVAAAGFPGGSFVLALFLRLGLLRQALFLVALRADAPDDHAGSAELRHRPDDALLRQRRAVVCLSVLADAAVRELTGLGLRVRGERREGQRGRSDHCQLPNHRMSLPGARGYADSNLLKFAPLMHFADKAFIAETTAKMLLEVKAVLFFQDKPFVFTSGWASPVYIDCRKLIFYPRIRSQLVDFAAATLARDVGFEQFDVIAGGETAGIPYAAWIAERLALPMQYVRKKPKGFGRNAQI